MSTEKRKMPGTFHIETGGWKHWRKLSSFAEAWEKEGREVDVVDVSVGGHGGVMYAVVDGAIVTVEVHGE